MRSNTTHRRERTALGAALLVLLAMTCSAMGQRGGGLFVQPKKEIIADRAAKKVDEDPNAARKILPLILPKKHVKEQRVPWHVMDGAGQSWQIYRNGHIQYGGSYLYSGGMQLTVSGSPFSQNDYDVEICKHRQEAQFGPWSRNNLKVYRRVRVYKDRGIARWLEILKNPTDKPIEVSLEIRTSLYGSVQEKKWTNGSENHKKTDWWAATRTHNYRNQDKLWTMHIFADPSAKTRPTVTLSNNDIHYKYNKITVPAGETVVLCHFEAQGEFRALQELLDDEFRPYKLLRDLPADARSRILNFPPTFSFAGLTVRRREEVDTIQLADKERTVRHGTIRTAAMTMQTSVGDFTVTADQIVCGTVSDANDTPDALVLGDGQVLVGSLQDRTMLFEAIDANQPEALDIKSIRAFSFAVSPKRPMEISFRGPYLRLEGGSRLAFDAERFRLDYLCRFGTLSLKPADIVRVRFSGRGAVCHRVQLTNGSLLAGFVRDSSLRMELRLGKTVSIRRHALTDLSFSDSIEPNPFLTRVELTNDDVLLGQLTDTAYPLDSAFGELMLTPKTIREMTFASSHIGSANITTWEGTQLRGVLKSRSIKLKLSDDLSIELAPSQCRSITRAQSLRPDDVLASANEILRKIRTLDDFDAHIGKLRKIGAGIVPLLKKKLRGPMNPDLRERWRELVAELTKDDQAEPSAPNEMFWGGPLVVPQGAFIRGG